MHTETQATINTLADEQTAYDWAREYAEGKRVLLRARNNVTPEVTVEIEECFDYNTERITKECARLNKIGQKYGQGLVTVEFSPTYWIRTVREEVKQDGEWIERKRKVACRTMVIASPTVLGQDGWRVLGVKVRVGDQAVVQTLPNETVPDRFYAPDMRCDHCHTVRARNEVVVLRDNSGGFGKFVQVGKQCLLEYTGIGPDYALLKAAFYTSKPWLANDGARYEEDLTPWLGWVAVAVRLDGRYISKATADNENEGRWHDYSLHARPEVQTTVNHAHTLRNRATFDRKQAEADGEVPTQQDAIMVERVVAYVHTLDPHQSTYHANLVALFRANVLLPRLDGLAASAFSGYLREQRAVAEAAERAKHQRPSEYLGQTGEKVVRDVTVTRVTEREGMYGTTYIYTFRTGEGDRVTWFSSRDMDFSVGDTLKLRGTIKNTEEFRGEKGTVLTRCTVL